MTKSFSDAKYKNPETGKAIVGWSGQDYVIKDKEEAKSRHEGGYSNTSKCPGAG